MTEIICPLQTAAKKYGNEIALIDSEREITYSEFNRLVCKTEQWLKSQNVKKYDRVAVLSENRVEFPILLIALLLIGAVTVPLNFRLPDASIAELVNQISCSHLLSSRDFKTTDITVISLNSLFSEIENVDYKESGSKMSLEQEATIIFTSGSTGQPKAVVHTLGNHFYNALGSNENILLQPGDRWAALLPFYHVGGLGILFRAILSGSVVVIPDPTENIFETNKSDNVTHCSVVPTQLYRLLKSKNLNVNSRNIKALLVGGGNVSDDLIEKVIEAGLPIHTTYGLTEMTSQVTTTPPGANYEILKTSGKILKYREIKISDEGEILVKGETLFKGYITQDGIEKAVDNKGWFHTGDLGALDNNGYLIVFGRRDNMFISGGENIYPEKIEAALLLLDGIEEAVVVGVDDPEFGQRPIAFLKSAVKIDSKRIRDSLCDSLPGYMIPIAFYELPKDNKQGGIKHNRKKLKNIAEELFSAKRQSS